MHNKSPQKRIKQMKEQLNNIIKDIEIIKEAISNGDEQDALQMLEDLKQDLKIISLIS